MIEVYFTRESLCMADDVNAPNIAKVILPEPFGEGEFQQAIQKYHGWDALHTWCGYVNGVLICKIQKDIYLTQTVLIVRLADGWRERVAEYKEIYFKRADSGTSIPQFGYAECEKMFRNPMIDVYGKCQNRVIDLTVDHLEKEDFCLTGKYL